MEEGENAPNYYQGSNIRDLEERQRILKDRLLLIGQNLIEFKENNEEELLEIKKDLEILKNSTEKMRSFLESLSGEISKLAKKEDLEILKKQAKMFQPLEFVKKSELEKLKKK
jgi:citrate synthase